MLIRILGNDKGTNDNDGKYLHFLQACLTALVSEISPGLFPADLLHMIASLPL